MIAEKVRAMLKPEEIRAPKKVTPPSGAELRRWARANERAGRKGQGRADRAAIARRRGTKPSAREMWPDLVDRLRQSRPVIEAPQIVPVLLKDGSPKLGANGLPFFRQTMGRFGAPTFRNVIDENGRHV